MTEADIEASLVECRKRRSRAGNGSACERGTSTTDDTVFELKEILAAARHFRGSPGFSIDGINAGRALARRSERGSRAGGGRNPCAMRRGLKSDAPHGSCPLFEVASNLRYGPIAILSGHGRARYKLAPRKGGSLSHGVQFGARENGVQPTGEDQELSAFRQRAFHERAPAGVFPPEAARLEGGHPEGGRGTRCSICRPRTENHPDLADRASSETDRAIELRARDRQRKLIAKIDAALQRIDDGTYGYCEETGEPIASSGWRRARSPRSRSRRRSATSAASACIATSDGARK